MPEAPYETDDIVFADESGNEIDDILGKRDVNRVNGMVNGDITRRGGDVRRHGKIETTGVGFNIFKHEKVSVRNDSVWI